MAKPTSGAVPVARSEPRTRTALLLEAIALRHQIAVLARQLANEGNRREPRKSRIQGEHILSSMDAFILCRTVRQTRVGITPVCGELLILGKSVIRHTQAGAVGQRR